MPENRAHGSVGGLIAHRGGSPHARAVYPGIKSDDVAGCVSRLPRTLTGPAVGTTSLPTCLEAAFQTCGGLFSCFLPSPCPRIGCGGKTHPPTSPPRPDVGFAQC